MTARRTLEQRGWVNFPVDKLPSTEEGGMYVQLVVVPRRREHWDEDQWMLCAHSLPVVALSDCLMHDGVHETPELAELPQDATPEQAKEWIDRTQEPSAPMAFHYPHVGKGESGGPLEREDYDSIPYLAVITLGSAGWSSGEWHCTFADLTIEGQHVYAMMQQLYAERGEVYLMTWLDT